MRSLPWDFTQEPRDPLPALTPASSFPEKEEGQEAARPRAQLPRLRCPVPPPSLG